MHTHTHTYTQWHKEWQRAHYVHVPFCEYIHNVYWMLTLIQHRLYPYFAVKDLDHGMVTVAAKFAMIPVLHKTLDGCWMLATLKAKERCPLTPRNTTTAVEAFIPKIMPSVSCLISNTQYAVHSIKLLASQYDTGAVSIMSVVSVAEKSLCSWSKCYSETCLSGHLNKTGHLSIAAKSERSQTFSITKTQYTKL